MRECPLYSQCPLADEILLAEKVELIEEYLKTPGVLTIEGLSKSYKEKYCDDNYQKCARFSVAENLGLAAVPDDLLPHQKERGKRIIQQNTY